MTDQTKPCPFCGGHPSLFPNDDDNGWWIGCDDCLTEMSHSNADSLIATWKTRTDLAEKRIAELEAANGILQAQKMRLISTQPDLAEEISQARNEALEEAARDITTGYKEYSGLMVPDSFKNIYTASRHQAADEIRALKEPTP